MGKRGGGRRYYRPEDVVLLRRIRDLLYSEGYTIKGVQKLLREGGGREDSPRSSEVEPQLSGLMDDGDVVPDSESEHYSEVGSDSDGPDAEQNQLVVTSQSTPNSLSQPVRHELEEILAELEQLRRFVQRH